MTTIRPIGSYSPALHPSGWVQFTNPVLGTTEAQRAFVVDGAGDAEVIYLPAFTL